MKKKLALMVAALAVIASMAVPSHAFTTIASCTGSASVNGCSTIFVALGNFDTVHVRFQPDFFFIGSATTQIFEVGNPLNQVNYESDWITGRIELNGPTFSDPYQLLAGHTYELIVSTNDMQNTFPITEDSGGLKGFVEV